MRFFRRTRRSPSLATLRAPHATSRVDARHRTELHARRRQARSTKQSKNVARRRCHHVRRGLADSRGESAVVARAWSTLTRYDGPAGLGFAPVHPRDSAVRSRSASPRGQRRSLAVDRASMRTASSARTKNGCSGCRSLEPRRYPRAQGRCSQADQRWRHSRGAPVRRPCWKGSLIAPPPDVALADDDGVTRSGGIAERGGRVATRLEEQRWLTSPTTRSPSTVPQP
jgi:hypothetical protein